jgi:uncharacterized protein
LPKRGFLGGIIDRANLRAEDALAVIRIDQTGVRNIWLKKKWGAKTVNGNTGVRGALETYRVTGRYDVKSPNCNIYKALFPEALRLEGLRLLKYAEDPEVVMQL